MKKLFMSAWLLCITMASHAQMRSSWGLDLGSISTVNYNAFGDHFGIEGSVGLLWKGFYYRDKGFTPIVAITSRYHFSRTSSEYRQRGLYLGLKAFGSFPRLDPRHLVDDNAWSDYTYQRWGVIPHLGWNIGVFTRSYINIWLGVAFSYSQYRNGDGELYWSQDIKRNPPESASGFRPIEGGISYNIRF